MPAWLRRHPVADADLSALVDGGLSARRRAAVESHVSACRLCRTAVAELGALKSMVAGLPETSAPRAFTLSHAADSLAAARPAPFPRYAFAPAAALAALVLLIGADLAAFEAQETAPSSAGAPAASKSLAAPQDAGVRATALAPPRTGESAAPTPIASAPAAARAGATDSGAAGAPVPAATTGADSARALQPQVAAPPVAPAPAESKSKVDRGRLRALEAAAAILFAVSLVYAIRKGRIRAP